MTAMTTAKVGVASEDDHDWPEEGVVRDVSRGWRVSFSFSSGISPARARPTLQTLVVTRHSKTCGLMLVVIMPNMLMMV